MKRKLRSPERRHSIFGKIKLEGTWRREYIYRDLWERREKLVPENIYLR